MYEIWDASPEIMQKGAKQAHHNAKYPWETLEVGKAFIIPHKNIKWKTLVPYCHRMSKKLGKSFVAKDHGPEVGYEVARLPDKGSDGDVNKT